MIPVLPALTVRLFEDEDVDALCELMDAQLRRSLYPSAINAQGVLAQLQQPQSYFAARWQSVRPLCAWRAGELVGFLDATTGFDTVNLGRPDHQPLGFLRFVALTERSDILNETLLVLLRAAEQFWLEQKVQSVFAFSNTMGYPYFQGGVGILPGDWDEIVRALTSMGYTFAHRFYLLRRDLQLMVEEDVPMADLRLEYQRSQTEVRYRIYYRLVEQVASARVLALEATEGESRPLHLLDISVAEPWRNRNIGKWLLRRIINDATMAGFDELIAFPSSRYSIALALFGQQGFIEQNYRGYSLEKELAQ
jgi:ribosomal protein S18 acetylase RimI-like enzyme